MLRYEKYVIIRLWGMSSRTWDYRGFPIGPLLTFLDDFWIEDDHFFPKYDKFHFLDKSADMADFYEKMLGKVVFRVFWPESII